MNGEETHLLGYKPCEQNDLVLLRWYGYLRTSGDIDTVFGKALQAPSAFLHYFQQPQVLMLDLDDNGDVWFAAWVEPFMTGAFFSLWCRADHRKSRQLLVNTEEALDNALRFFPLLIGVTQHEKLIDEHIRLGYTHLGKIPGLVEGNDASVLYITRESFQMRQAFSLKSPHKEVA
jgi:hypothetical protein